MQQWRFIVKKKLIVIEKLQWQWWVLSNADLYIHLKHCRQCFKFLLLDMGHMATGINRNTLKVERKEEKGRKEKKKMVFVLLYTCAKFSELASNMQFEGTCSWCARRWWGLPGAGSPPSPLLPPPPCTNQTINVNPVSVQLIDQIFLRVSSYVYNSIYVKKKCLEKKSFWYIYFQDYLQTHWFQRTLRVK